jgi:serine/threonine protein kinase
MPAPTKTDEFLDLVRKSGLVNPDQIDKLQGQVNGDDESAPKKLAGLFISAGLLTQFQAEQFLLGKWRGFTIGKYKVLERLGFGGTGTVYLCEHLMVHRKVAIKVLPATKADNPAALGRFYREARAAGILEHPNLVKCHDIDQDNGLHFLVMDYIDGSSLQHIIAKFGPMAVDRAANYVRQSALGLQAAHQAGLVHRDIKPANIIVDRKGVVRVLDLGLARFFMDDQDLLTLKYDDKNVLGTADYVAPEQALNSHHVDIRADIYGLGATFYFLLAGHPPFPEGKAAQKLIWHQVRQPKPIHEIRPEVPEGLATIVHKMLAKKPEDRYPAPADVVAALAPFTKTPVAPPADEEMPRLCLAARATSTHDTDLSAIHAQAQGGMRLPSSSTLPRTTLAGPVGTSPADTNLPEKSTTIRKGRAVSMADLAGKTNGAQTIGDNGHAAHAGVRSGDRAPTGSPQVGARSPDRAPAPPTLGPRSPDHGPATNGAPTRPSDAAAPATERKPIKKTEKLVKPAAPESRMHIRRLVAVLVASSLIGVILRFGVFAPGAKIPAHEPVVLKVSHSGEPGTFPNIQMALLKSQPGDRIQICEEVWEEALQLTGDDGLGREVTIESGLPNARPVQWRLPQAHKEDQPLLKLSGFTSLAVRGCVLDGQDRVQNLIVLSGSCPGLMLEDLHLKGFRQSALCFRDCQGGNDLPVSVHRVRVTPTRESVSALTFEGRPEDGNANIAVADCRFEGPYQAAVILAGPVSDVEFKRNRIYNTVDGLLYRRTSPVAPLRLTLANNTFAAVEKTALRLETTPARDRSHVVLTGNLFTHTTTLGQIDDFRPEPRATQAQWVWGDEPQPPGAAPEVRYFRKTFSVDGVSVSHAVLNLACESSYTVWVNGERVGHGDFLGPTRRVDCFDVVRYLKPGANVIAVQATGKAGGPSGLLAQLTYACPGDPHITLLSDATWKTTRTAAANWHQPAAVDSQWAWARVVAPYGKGDAGWQHLVWDTVIQDHFNGKVDELFAPPSGNVCDRTCQEGFPSFKAAALNFELPTDPTDDSRFLRYPPQATLLIQAGSPGVPPGK